MMYIIKSGKTPITECNKKWRLILFGNIIRCENWRDIKLNISLPIYNLLPSPAFVSTCDVLTGNESQTKHRMPVVRHKKLLYV
jgi:hypothetical protein